MTTSNNYNDLTGIDDDELETDDLEITTGDEDEDEDYIPLGEFSTSTAVQHAEETVELHAHPAHAGERVDRVLVALRPDLSRSHIQKLIEDGNLLVNGNRAKAGQKLRGAETLRFTIPPAQPLAHLEPENIPLDIIFEDDSVIVINKSAGLVVHPAPGHATGTLVNALLFHVPNLNINGSQRPGIVHRLDKDTSGLLVAAKTDAALNNLIIQMKNHETLKEYQTLLDGDLQPPSGIIDAPIGRDPQQRKRMAVIRNGKSARTHFTTLEPLMRHTLVQARLETGRTHQIRVHFSYLKHPVVGDQVYGFRKPSLPLNRQFLHAAKLGFKLPSTGEYREFEAPLPADLIHTLALARNLAT